MTWRKFHWILVGLMVVVAVVRIMTGHLLGALLPIALAVVFASIAADFPLIQRVRQGWRMLRRLWRIRG